MKNDESRMRKEKVGLRSENSLRKTMTVKGSETPSKKVNLNR